MFGILEADCGYISKNECTRYKCDTCQVPNTKTYFKAAQFNSPWRCFLGLYQDLERGLVQRTSKWWEFHGGNAEQNSILSRTNLGNIFRMSQWKKNKKIIFYQQNQIYIYIFFVSCCTYLNLTVKNLQSYLKIRHPTPSTEVPKLYQGLTTRGIQ